MNSSSKFVVAIHIMTGLASRWTYFNNDSLKSDFLANSCNTNPVVIRRILSSLNKAGLIESKSGPQGGSCLAKSPDEISLADIYKAVEQEDIIFHYHYKEPDENCPVGANIQDTLSELLSPLTDIVTDYLETITLEKVFSDVMNKSGLQKYIKQGYTPAEIEKMIQSCAIPVKE